MSRGSHIHCGGLTFLHQQFTHLVCRRLVYVRRDLAVGEHERTVGVRRGDRIMRDHDDGLSEFVDRTLQEAEHFGAGDGVEVAGRLVGEHQLRLGR